MNLKTIAVVQATDTVVDESKRQRGIRHEEDSDENAWLLGIAWDDVIGALLDPREVRKAQLKEVDYLHEKHVYTKISRAEAQRRGIKILPTRWVDVNKGDAINTHHRSRFVAMEFITTKLDGLFASTPPLETFKLLISDVAAKDDVHGDAFEGGGGESNHGQRHRPCIFRGSHQPNSCSRAARLRQE